MVGKFDHNDNNLSSPLGLSLKASFIFFVWGGQPINDAHHKRKKKKKYFLPPMVEEYVHSSVIKHD
jgi:hypothetical protein